MLSKLLGWTYSSTGTQKEFWSRNTLESDQFEQLRTWEDNIKKDRKEIVGEDESGLTGS